MDRPVECGRLLVARDLSLVRCDNGNRMPRAPQNGSDAVVVRTEAVPNFRLLSYRTSSDVAFCLSFVPILVSFMVSLLVSEVFLCRV